MKSKKEFHCVDFKRKVQKEIYKEIWNLTPDEEIEYFRCRVKSGVFGKLWRKLQEGSAGKSSHSRQPLDTSILRPS